jgi:phosphodiesterase/alkaline phosphatase D-like protein
MLRVLAAAVAVAASAPAVTTGPVTAVGPTTATVSGTVNPNGAATTWHVEYGTTTGYGSQSPSVNAGSGTSATAVSADLTGLKVGTTYHYRFVATNSSGTTEGADGLLTTSAAPQAVTGSASSVTTSSATLNGTVNPNGRATTWYFEYGTSTSYGAKTSAKNAGLGTSATSVSAPVTGLTALRTYHFRLVATSDAGTSTGSDQTFVTSAAPVATTDPASSVGDTSARLNGRVTPNGSSTTWYFEYGTTTSYGSKTSAKSAGSGTKSTSVNVTVSNLAPGATYHFRVVATSESGTTTAGDQSFTTSGPPVVHTGAASNIGAGNATLNGTVDRNGHSTSWYFEYGTSTSYGTRTATTNASSDSGPQPVSVTVSNLAPGTTYHYRLVATSGSRTGTGSDATFMTPAPTLTLSTSSPIVSFGHAVTVSGALSTRIANRTVTVYVQRPGQSSFVSLATVLTRSDGTWSMKLRPSIGALYRAACDGGVSAVRTIAVRPSVSLRVLTKHRLTTHVSGARSFAGRVVQLQRRAHERWQTIVRVPLNRYSSAVFHPTLPPGRSTLRVAISVNQAGAGYLAGFSRTISYRVR